MTKKRTLVYAARHLSTDTTTEQHLYWRPDADAARAMGVHEVQAYCGHWVAIGDPDEDDTAVLVTRDLAELMFTGDDCFSCCLAVENEVRRGYVVVPSVL